MNGDLAAATAVQANSQTSNGAEGAPAPQPRGERGPRRERGERGGNRGERTLHATEGQEGSAAPAAGDFADTAPLASLPDLDLTGNNDAPANGNGPATDEQRRERRSRDRYGRDRRERGERGPRESTGTEEQAPASALVDFDLTATSPAPATADEAPRRSYFSTPSAEQLPSAPAAAPAATPAPTATAVAEQAAAEPLAPVAAVPPATAGAAPAVAPEATQAKGMPRVQPFTLPVDTLQQVAAASGLQWVNSDADKVAAAQAAIAAEPQPVRVPRERPPAVVLDEGPLVLVETRRDLAEMKLPFEGTTST